jgi:hypothetical protein
MQAPGAKIWGALGGASTTQASLCSCISSPLSSPAQPLRIRHPAVNAVNPAAPPQGSPLSTHHQPHHVSCFLHMGCHTFAEQRVCASVLPLVSSCLTMAPLARIPRTTWRPPWVTLASHLLPGLSSTSPSRSWFLFILGPFGQPQRLLVPPLILEIDRDAAPGCESVCPPLP